MQRISPGLYLVVNMAHFCPLGSHYALLLALALALVAVDDTSAAGMTAHNVMAHRALQHFNESVPGFEALARGNWPSVSAGAPFPDYLYTCGDSHDAGEEDHWPPFQVAAANYIRANFTMEEIQTPGSRANLLTAFMMGAVSHYVTDMNWHGIGTVPSAQGFIEQLGTSNFNCSGELCQTAHSTADVGGEFVSAWELNMTFYAPRAWEVPVDDIVRIFAYANATLDPSQVLNASLPGAFSPVTPLAPSRLFPPLTPRSVPRGWPAHSLAATSGRTRGRQACYGQVCFPLVEPQWVTDCAFLFAVGSWAIKVRHLHATVFILFQIRPAGSFADA